MSNSHATRLTFRGLDLWVHYAVEPGQPAILFGPPERCQEGFPEEISWEKVELIAEIPDDLSPNARAKREVHLDISPLFESSLDLSGQLLNSLITHLEAEADASREPPPKD